jgi:uncharacterized BrkB/YihY/UPF0761 family membrane protein
MKKQEKQRNIVGILGISVGWAIPLAGFVLGIVSLCLKEKEIVGALSIILSLFFWIFWMAVFFAIF